MPSTLVSSTEMRSTGTITVAAGVTTVAVVVTNPDPGTMTASAGAAYLAAELFDPIGTGAELCYESKPSGYCEAV